jgi:hypothetical protein
VLARLSPYNLLIGVEIARTLVRMDTATAEEFLAALFALREDPGAGALLWEEPPVCGRVADLDVRSMIFYTVDESARALSVTAITWQGNWPV